MYELIENYKKLLRVAVKSKKIVDTWLGPAVFVAAIFDMDVEAMYRSFIAELIFWVNWIFQRKRDFFSLKIKIKNTEKIHLHIFLQNTICCMYEYIEGLPKRQVFILAQS